MSEYTEQAEKFLNDHNATIAIEYLEKVYNPWNDHRNHDVYSVTIEREGMEPYSFTFTQSAVGTMDGIEPDAYDVLACVQKYDCGTYKDFCSDFGYDGSEESYDTWQAVKKEYENIERLFGDCMDELCEIE